MGRDHLAHVRLSLLDDAGQDQQRVPYPQLDAAQLPGNPPIGAVELPAGVEASDLGVMASVSKLEVVATEPAD